MLKLDQEVWNFDDKCFRKMGNIKLVTARKHEILEEFRFRLATQMKTRVFFLNAHCFNIAQKNSGYLRNLNAAEFVLNDGVGVELGARAFHISFSENLKVTDFTPDVLEILNQEKMSLYLLGGSPGVAEEAAENILKEFPDIILSGTSNGFFTDPIEVLNDINQVKPDLLLVGMGVPAQEGWISHYFEELDATLIMGVGAYFDFAAGNTTTAPALIRKIRMEGVYRVLLEPKRMFKRYVVGNVQFCIHIFKLSRLHNHGT
ncbi:WecB/TagA/CpsF family glycosyltransferase [Planococcus sp. X10-3]|uniref:WecB/TagA/CpsF family glycosyltransferase n=1 Tax=Planococcus sp. X10-3 TaxID=3061240 RepID=UPI003BB03509